MRFTFIASVLLMLSACQTPMQTGSQCVVPDGYLSGASTFTWHEGKALDVEDRTGYVSPIVERGLNQAVIAELEGKGFQFTEEATADFTVKLTLRTRRELISVTIDESPCYDNDCWERVDPGSSTRMDMRTIGFLAADVYVGGEPIWRGWAERNLYPEDRDDAAEVVDEAVPALFETFPP